MTTTKVQLPGILRSTFWAKNTIETLLPEPCVCQNTPEPARAAWRRVAAAPRIRRSRC